MLMTELPPINKADPSSNVIWAVPLSAVRILTPISRGIIAEIISQSSAPSTRIPVAPINGFKRIGGITSAASSTTSTGVGAIVVVVEEVVVVSSITGVEELSSPPHAEIINENTLINIKNFLFLLTPIHILMK